MCDAAHFSTQKLICFREFCDNFDSELKAIPNGTRDIRREHRFCIIYLPAECVSGIRLSLLSVAPLIPSICLIENKTISKEFFAQEFRSMWKFLEAQSKPREFPFKLQDQIWWNADQVFEPSEIQANVIRVK